MKHKLTFNPLWIIPAILLLAGCSKAYDGDPTWDGPEKDSSDAIDSSGDLAIGTLRSREGTRFVRLDETSYAYVFNPEEVEDIPDVSRIFLEYRNVRANKPEFCTESIYIVWASVLDVGTVSSSGNNWDDPGNPVGIITDWVTSLEDGFLTLHYSIPSSGTAQHAFILVKSKSSPHTYSLVHHANGDTEGTLTDGIVCFPVEDLLPDTGGETVQLTLEYLNLDSHTSTLTVDYRSPK